jgi:hypothetical protein
MTMIILETVVDTLVCGCLMCSSVLLVSLLKARVMIDKGVLFFITSFNIVYVCVFINDTNVTATIVPVTRTSLTNLLPL